MKECTSDMCPFSKAHAHAIISFINLSKCPTTYQLSSHMYRMYDQILLHYNLHGLVMFILLNTYFMFKLLYIAKMQWV